LRLTKFLFDSDEERIANAQHEKSRAYKSHRHHAARNLAAVRHGTSSALNCAPQQKSFAFELFVNAPTVRECGPEKLRHLAHRVKRMRATAAVADAHLAKHSHRVCRL